MMLFNQDDTSLLRILHAVSDSDRYVDRLSALSLIQIDTFDAITEENISMDYHMKQPIPGMRLLVNDVIEVLNEYARLEEVKSDETRFDQIDDDLEEAELLEAIAKRAQTVAWRSCLQEVAQQRQRIEKKYVVSVLPIDHKVSVLLAIEEILEEFLQAISTAASKAGVLNADSRANAIIQRCLLQISHHRYFNVDEDDTRILDLKKKIAHLSFNGRGAMAERYLARRDLSSQRDRFFIGHKFIAGCLCVMSVWFVLESLTTIRQHVQDNTKDPALGVFSSVGNIVLLLAAWGCVCTFLRRCNINYLDILQLPLPTSAPSITQPQEHSHWIANSKQLEQTISRGCMELTAVFLASFILYSRCTALLSATHIVSHAIPTGLLFYVFYRFLFPIRSRAPWLHVLELVLISPLSSVSFRDSFIGDLLTSTVRLVAPLTTSILYVIIATFSFLITGDVPPSEIAWWHNHMIMRSIVIPFLTLYPLWIRLVQCLRRSVETGNRWPHFANALKYTSALVVSSIGIFKPGVRTSSWWILAFMGATVYQFTWDLTMDWGLLVASKSAPLGYTLRSTRLVGSQRLYYTVAAINLTLRFAWSLTLLPEALIADDTVATTLLAHLEPLVASVEILRRMMWSVLRVEWEHIETHAIGTSVEEDQDLEQMEIKTWRDGGILAAVRDMYKQADDGEEGNPTQRLMESIVFALSVIILIVVIIRLV